MCSEFACIPESQLRAEKTKLTHNYHKELECNCYMDYVMTFVELRLQVSVAPVLPVLCGSNTLCSASSACQQEIFGGTNFCGV